MIRQASLLVKLVVLVGLVPTPRPPAKRGRGRPKFYRDNLFLKALVIMIVQHLRTAHELLRVLEQPTAEIQTLRKMLTEDGHYILADGPLSAD